MLNIEPPFTGRYAFLHTGFRPFFALASVGAVVLMLLWTGIFSVGTVTVPSAYPAISWHAYEMIYGFAMAVVAGFLLTAVKNWTHLKTLEGYPLLGLALVWVLARVLPFVTESLLWPALVELLFLVGLLAAVTRPIVQVKQWAQMAIVGKLALLLPACIVFYLGLAGVWPAGISVGLYAGFFLLLGLVLTLARRVMPMFIERGINNGFLVKNDPTLDRWSLILFLVFAIADTGLQAHSNGGLSIIVTLLAFAQAVVHAKRLAGWYHKAIWEKPMVWVLVAAYGWLVLGFALKALVGLGWATQSIAVHAFSIGGVGLVTLGMMARVSLGHTGRNPNEPPKAVGAVFILLVLAAVFRVLGVWLLPSFYSAWIVAGQVCWMLAFGLFASIYLPMWVKARLGGGRG